MFSHYYTYNLRYLFRIVFCGRFRILRVLVSSWCVCGVLVLMLLSLTSIQDKIVKVTKLIDCDDEASEAFLQNLCINYTKGLTSGSLCYPLCTGEIIYKECLGHGVKPHVLRATWKEKDIILKVKRTLDENRVVKHLSDLHPDMLGRQYFDIVANLSFINSVLDLNTTVGEDVFDYLYSECAGTNRNLSYHEMWYCYALLESDEFLLSVLLKHSSYCVPNLYGTCGNVFGVEHLPVEMLESFTRLIFDERSWLTKVQLGLAMLEMVKRLDHTPYGTFYLCDVQFTNFGVLQLKSGMIVVPIDADIAWLKPQMKQVMVGESMTNCSSDLDCHFISCLGKCNQVKKKCEPHLYSNNLINICRLIFTTPHSSSLTKFGLFDIAPPTIKLHLSLLIKKCSMPSVTPWPRTSHIMIEQFQRLLHQSIR